MGSVDTWKTWRPANDGEESKFCDLVCSECTKNIENEGGYPVGCIVLHDTINIDGDQIVRNEARGKIKCLQQNIDGDTRCKDTPDLFGDSK